ncbi:hypothetical protein L195_g014683 [Trifolium pratense]|uniref:Uncharacterized protein n=2 Tax=Trifolium pratense TaxID=57577 RepID=A0A2K3PRN2_TRIPR|nr:hypothetical protein L195_g014683 [Trifolium pratense]
MKKKGISRINPNDPSYLRHKKAKFIADHEKSTSRLEESDHSQLPLQREIVTTCDPKTSEYAFFKKLKKDASLRFSSGPVKKDDSWSSKKPESDDCSKEGTDDVRVGTKECNSSRINQDVSTFKMDSFLSPSVGDWNKSDMYSMSRMLKNSQECGDTVKPQGFSHAGNQYAHGEIFSRKRQKLRQCAADTLFPDTEKPCSKGFDIVSLLLSRLFPMTTDSTVTNKYEDPNPGKIKKSTIYDLLDSRELGVQFKEHYLIPKRKLLELESGSYFNDQMLSPMFLESGERITPHAELPTYHFQNFEPRYSITAPKCKLSGTPSFSASVKGDNDITPGSLFNEVKNAPKYSLLDSRELGFQCTELQPKRKPLELKSGSYLNDQMLSPTFFESGEGITPYAEFPTYHSRNFQPRYNITAPECKLSGTPNFSASVKDDITLGPLFNEVENAAEYSLLDYQELDFQCTELHQIPRRKLLELKSSSSFIDHLLPPMFLRSVESITPYTDFPIDPHKFRPVFRTEAERKFGGTPIYLDKNDASYGFLCKCNDEKNHETFTFDHFKEPGKLEREPIPLLMEKDFDCKKDEIKLPITCKYAKPYMAPALSILDHGQEQISNDSLDEFHFRPSSLLLPKDFNSVMDSGLFRYQNSPFGEYVYKWDEEMDTNFNHTALSFSHNNHYFKLSENCKDDASFIQDSIYLPPYHHWVRETVSSDYHHHPDKEPWLSSSPRCLSLTSSHSNYQSSITRNLQLPESENMSSLFHIDDNYKPKINDGDQGEVLYHLSEAFVEIYNSSFLHMSNQRDNGCPFSLDDSDNINDQEQRHEMLL